MPPGGEPVQGVGRDPQGQHTRENQSRDGKGHRTHGAGTKIGNQQEGAEEHQGRAEVIHQCQKAADQHGIGDKQEQVPFAHDPVHGGRAREHEADLAQLRRLQGHTADDQPVFRTVILRTEHQRHQQKAHTCRHGKVPDHLRPLQIPQRPAQNQEGNNSQNHGTELLHCFIRPDGGDGCHTHGTQEEGDGLHLEGFPVDHTIEYVKNPLAEHDAAKPLQNVGKVRLLPPEQVAEQNHALYNCQQHQIGHAVPAAGGLGAKLRLAHLLPGGNGLKLHFHAANGDPVPGFQGTDLNGAVIDEGSRFGAHIQQRPAAVVIAGQHRVVPGNRGKIDGHVTAFAPADDVLPVGNGDLGAVGQIQPCPDFRLPPEGQQRVDAPKQQQKHQHRHRIAQKSDVLHRQLCRVYRQRAKKFFHFPPPFSKQVTIRAVYPI